jgi:hypothetical protein
LDVIGLSNYHDRKSAVSAVNVAGVPTESFCWHWRDRI